MVAFFEKLRLQLEKKRLEEDIIFAWDYNDETIIDTKNHFFVDEKTIKNNFLNISLFVSSITTIFGNSTFLYCRKNQITLWWVSLCNALLSPEQVEQ